MSYNYLPLDRKWLHFQQVKNLLDYDQLVSITFDAHERILKCRSYVDNICSAVDTKDTADNIQKAQINVIKSNVVATGEELPAEIVKLMMMLKIKSLGWGHSGVQIETVKRLMEMYNNGILPVVYTSSPERSQGDVAALSQLALPLVGWGEVYYQGQKWEAKSVLEKLNWQPITLQNYEGYAVTTGTEFTSAYGLFALKKAEHALKLADVIAALTFAVSGTSTKSLNPNIHSLRAQKGQAETASAILKYLNDGGNVAENKETNPAGNLPVYTTQIHGAAKDAFEHVLNVFLKEANSVTESPIVFPDEDLVVEGGCNRYHLTLALDYLALAISGLANTSLERSQHLINDQKNLEVFSESCQQLQTAAATIRAEVVQLSTPTSVDYRSEPGTPGTANNSARRCIQLLDHVNRLLAIEFLAAVQARELSKPGVVSELLNRFVIAFRKHTSPSTKTDLSIELEKAIEFISSYKL
jgi:histidine ammonia-lyase